MQIIDEVKQAPASRPCSSCGGTAVTFQRDMGNSRLLECSTCGSVYSERVPDEEELTRIYKELYASGSAYQEHRAELDRMRNAKATGKTLRVGWERHYFFEQTNALSNGRLLDVGCGTGFFLFAANQRGWDSRGVELTKDAAELGHAVHGRPVHNGRIEDSVFTQGEFTAVTAWEVMEHIAEPLGFLHQVSGLLKPGGVFGGSIPNYGRLRYRHGTDLGIASIPPVHLNFWTPASLLALLAKAGFVDIHIYIPKIVWGLLTSIEHEPWRKILRFIKVALGADVPTTMAFVATRP